jgi:6-phosphofructokinase 1
MQSTLKRFGILTSGGDAPGMNAAIRAIVRSAVYQGLEPYGILRGYAGLVSGECFPMDARSVRNIIHTGGTVLKTARSKAFTTPEGRREAYQTLRNNLLEGLIVIGGNGTYTGARAFASEYPEVPVIGLPGTIDNDLWGTDNTIGFDTAVNTAIRAVDQIRDTADATNRIFFIEVMGRQAGFLALHTAVACGAEAVLLPERKTDLAQLSSALSASRSRQKTASIVIVAEGDDAGGAFEVARQVKQELAEEEEIRVSVLGYLQRGGAPTAQDRLLASQLGNAAVEALMGSRNGIALGLRNGTINAVNFDEAITTDKPLNADLVDMIDILSI